MPNKANSFEDDQKSIQQAYAEFLGEMQKLKKKQNEILSNFERVLRKKHLDKVTEKIKIV